jgi:hypothetical protein
LDLRFGTLIWDPDLKPRFGNPIWNPDLGPQFLRVHPTFRTPISRLMPNVISKIKQNSSDMNEIILAPCDAGYVQNCTGFKWVFKLTLGHDYYSTIVGV